MGQGDVHALPSHKVLRERRKSEVHAIRPSVLHLMRGQVFSINKRTFFTFGGAQSHDVEDGIFEPDDPELARIRRISSLGYDKFYRVNHMNWWKEELPSDEEMNEGICSLESAGWNVDYILSHCLPTPLHMKASEGYYTPDILTDYLAVIQNRCAHKHWYCGHYHWDHAVTDKVQIVYSRILPVG